MDFSWISSLVVLWKIIILTDFSSKDKMKALSQSDDLFLSCLFFKR